MPPEKKRPETLKEMQAELDRKVEDHINKLAREKGVDPLVIKIHLIDFLSGKK